MPFPFLLDDQEGSLMLSVMCDDRRGGQGDMQADAAGWGGQDAGPCASSSLKSPPGPEGRYLFMLSPFQLAWDLGRHWT